MGNLQRVAPILNLILTQNLNKMNMIIYEVNLSIETVLETSFIPWLKTHINKMLKFDGFIDASLFIDAENNHTSKNWVVQYKVESMAHLEDYFNLQAKRMRKEPLDRFCDGFTATKRILKVEV